jgi:uncharacterized membrane protein HdeD (DUF308 family)
MADRKVTVTIDPTLQMQRHLSYKEKESGWEVYRAVYWGIYVFIVGVLVLTALPTGVLNATSFIGWAMILLAMFVIVYGFVLSLHLKLMKKHA